MRRNIDPTTVATIWHSMQTICKEMRHIVKRTAQNYLIGQLQDMSVGIWGADGATIAVPVGLPVQFLGTTFAVQDLVKKFAGDINPGDVFLTNDPYHGGHNCHLPDWGYIRPIFYKGELMFFVLCRGHQMDTGGSFPGGYFPNGYDIHAEGIIIPPIKVVERGKRAQRRHRSDPQQCALVGRREDRPLCHDRRDHQVRDGAILALLDMYGKRHRDGLRAGNAHAHRDRGARRDPQDPRRRLYRRSRDRRRRHRARRAGLGARAITVKGDEMTLDLSESDAQRKGFVNSVYAATYGNAIAAAFLYFDPALADYHNQGTMAPIKVIAPLGSVVNCKYPATVGASPVNVGNQVMEAVLEALSKAMPDRAVAAWGKHRGDYVFAVDPRTGERYVRTTFDYDGSGGAVWGYDGYQGVSTITALGAVNRGNVEEMEVRVPWRAMQWEIVPDFSGAGRWRGGPGIHWEAVNEGSAGQMATGSSDGDVVLGFGASAACRRRSPVPICAATARTSASSRIGSCR